MNLPNGFHFRETPGHGYLVVSARYNDNVPAFLRKHEYEEDCAYSIPIVFNKDLFSENDFAQAMQSFKDWFPADYERAFKTTLKRGESLMKDKYYYDRMDNVGKYSKSVGMGSWCYDVPKGMVYAELVEVTPPKNYGFDAGKGKEISVLMPSNTYNSKDFFTPEDFTPYQRNEQYYTWEEYTKKTGKPRFK